MGNMWECRSGVLRTGDRGTKSLKLKYLVLGKVIEMESKQKVMDDIGERRAPQGTP